MSYRFESNDGDEGTPTIAFDSYGREIGQWVPEKPDYEAVRRILHKIRGHEGSPLGCICERLAKYMVDAAYKPKGGDTCDVPGCGCRVDDHIR